MKIPFLTKKKKKRKEKYDVISVNLEKTLEYLKNKESLQSGNLFI